MKTLFHIAVVCAVFGLAASSAMADLRNDARTTNDLKQIGLAYHNCIDATGKPPANAKALAPFFENDKRILGLLEKEDIVFFYGVGIAQMTAGTSNTILAFEKDAPTKGGLVLMGDASVKKVSADDFKKANLAGKLKEK
jgi:hypothetical protein